MPSARQGSSEPRGGPGPESRYHFPHPETADEDGFVAAGGDLSPGTLVHAYSNGMFPWTTNPITWWSPDPRAVFPVDGIHVSRSLARHLRRTRLRITYDTAFRKVMEECARSRPGRRQTWISRRFITGYTGLFELGYAHSVEVWNGETLAGGMYGVAIGSFYAGESMFSNAENGSKVALVAMARRLRECGFTLFDTQFLTEHLASMGAVEISREEYLRRLREAIAKPVLFQAEPEIV
jgi:leucyl/phenylalanyl-tRNA---protein transferase